MTGRQRTLKPKNRPTTQLTLGKSTFERQTVGSIFFHQNQRFGHQVRKIDRGSGRNGQYSGMISFDVTGDEKAHQRFLDALTLITHAVSLGDVESLIVYYDRNSDKLPHYPKVFQEGFFRFSVGLEDAEDIIDDLSQAMKKAGIL